MNGGNKPLNQEIAPSGSSVPVEIFLGSHGDVSYSPYDSMVERAEELLDNDGGDLVIVVEGSSVSQQDSNAIHDMIRDGVPPSVAYLTLLDPTFSDRSGGNQAAELRALDHLVQKYPGRVRVVFESTLEGRHFERDLIKLSQKQAEVQDVLQRAGVDSNGEPSSVEGLISICDRVLTQRLVEGKVEQARELYRAQVELTALAQGQREALAADQILSCAAEGNVCGVLVRFGESHSGIYHEIAKKAGEQREIRIQPQIHFIDRGGSADFEFTPFSALARKLMYLGPERVTDEDVDRAFVAEGIYRAGKIAAQISPEPPSGDDEDIGPMSYEQYNRKIAAKTVKNMNKGDIQFAMDTFRERGLAGALDIVNYPEIKAATAQCDALEAMYNAYHVLWDEDPRRADNALPEVADTMASKIEAVWGLQREYLEQGQIPPKDCRRKAIRLIRQPIPLPESFPSDEYDVPDTINTQIELVESGVIPPEKLGWRLVRQGDPDQDLVNCRVYRTSTGRYVKVYESVSQDGSDMAYEAEVMADVTARGFVNTVLRVARDDLADRVDVFRGDRYVAVVMPDLGGETLEDLLHRLESDGDGEVDHRIPLTVEELAEWAVHTLQTRVDNDLNVGNILFTVDENGQIIIHAIDCEYATVTDQNRSLDAGVNSYKILVENVGDTLRLLGVSYAELQGLTIAYPGLRDVAQFWHPYRERWDEGAQASNIEFGEHGDIAALVFERHGASGLNMWLRSASDQGDFRDILNEILGVRELRDRRNKLVEILNQRYDAETRQRVVDFAVDLRYLDLALVAGRIGVLHTQDRAEIERNIERRRKLIEKFKAEGCGYRYLQDECEILERYHRDPWRLISRAVNLLRTDEEIEALLRMIQLSEIEGDDINVQEMLRQRTELQDRAGFVQEVMFQIPDGRYVTLSDFSLSMLSSGLDPKQGASHSDLGRFTNAVHSLIHPAETSPYGEKNPLRSRLWSGQVIHDVTSINGVACPMPGEIPGFDEDGRYDGVGLEALDQGMFAEFQKTLLDRIIEIKFPGLVDKFRRSVSMVGERRALAASDGTRSLIAATNFTGKTFVEPAVMLPVRLPGMLGDLGWRLVDTSVNIGAGDLVTIAMLLGRGVTSRRARGAVTSALVNSLLLAGVAGEGLVVAGERARGWSIKREIESRRKEIEGVRGRYEELSAVFGENPYHDKNWRTVDSVLEQVDDALARGDIDGARGLMNGAYRAAGDIGADIGEIRLPDEEDADQGGEGDGGQSGGDRGSGGDGEPGDGRSPVIGDSGPSHGGGGAGGNSGIGPADGSSQSRSPAEVGEPSPKVDGVPQGEQSDNSRSEHAEGGGEKGDDADPGDEPLGEDGQKEPSSDGRGRGLFGLFGRGGQDDDNTERQEPQEDLEPSQNDQNEGPGLGDVLGAALGVAAAGFGKAAKAAARRRATESRRRGDGVPDTTRGTSSGRSQQGGAPSGEYGVRRGAQDLREQQKLQEPQRHKLQHQSPDGRPSDEKSFRDPRDGSTDRYPIDHEYAYPSLEVRPDQVDVPDGCDVRLGEHDVAGEWYELGNRAETLSQLAGRGGVRGRLADMRLETTKSRMDRLMEDVQAQRGQNGDSGSQSSKMDIPEFLANRR